MLIHGRAIEKLVKKLKIVGRENLLMFRETNITLTAKNKENTPSQWLSLQLFVRFRE